MEMDGFLSTEEENRACLRNSDIFPSKYKIGKMLGHGTFGTVRFAEHVPTGYGVAIKIINRVKIMKDDNKKNQLWEKVKREMKISKIFSRIAHPHIIRIYEIIETQSDILIVMEYVKSGELFDHIVEKGRLPECNARNFFQQIISGVECFHTNMMVHRDIKPENILLDEKLNAKIADFGFTNILRDGYFLKTSCGSANYAAPELLCSKLYAGPEADIWSCGVTLYALLCGVLPFDDANIPLLYRKIKSGKYMIPCQLSAGAMDIIARMLVVDPEKRITLPMIHQHPWFQIQIPRYLVVLPSPSTMYRSSKIDHSIMEETIKIGFDENHLLDSLHNRIQNQATVSYYLLLDNRSCFSNHYLEAEFQQTMDWNHDGGGYVDVVTGLPERNWTVGIQSTSPPYQIMIEVLRALQELNIVWKRIGDYNMRCRWFSTHPCVPVNEVSHSSSKTAQMEVKFELQLYKTKEKRYLLDIQRLIGTPIVFLDLCGAFLAHLCSSIIDS